MTIHTEITQSEAGEETFEDQSAGESLHQDDSEYETGEKGSENGEPAGEFGDDADAADDAADDADADDDPEEAPVHLMDHKAVAECIRAWHINYNAQRAKGRSDFDATREANQGYLDAMPPLAGRKGIRDFIACVCQAYLWDIIGEKRTARLFAAAKLAICALTAKPRRVKIPAALRKSLKNANSESADSSRELKKGRPSNKPVRKIARATGNKKKIAKIA